LLKLTCRKDLDPLVRWDVDPASLAVESYGQSALDEIQRHSRVPPLFVAEFMRDIHTRIDTLKDMEGESLYWRYTLAFALARVIALPLRCGSTLYATIIVEGMKTLLANWIYRWRVSSSKVRASRSLAVLGVEDFIAGDDLERHYPRSWAFLQELSFGWENWRDSWLRRTLTVGRRDDASTKSLERPPVQVCMDITCPCHTRNMNSFSLKRYTGSPGGIQIIITVYR
jgi:hypothetical protein